MIQVYDTVYNRIRHIVPEVIKQIIAEPDTHGGKSILVVDDGVQLEHVRVAENAEEVRARLDAGIPSDWREIVKVINTRFGGDIQPGRAKADLLTQGADCRDEWSERLRKQAAIIQAAHEVWSSIPSARDDDDPTVQRHAKALNNLGAVLGAFWRSSPGPTGQQQTIGKAGE